MNTTNTLDPEVIREEVRRRYGAIARGTADTTAAAAGLAESSCCSSSTSASSTTCCAGPSTAASASQESCGCSADAQARTLGYTEAELAAVPEGANLGLGCGNPVAIASLQPGQTVLDLGAGAGFDAFLAARAVGPTGRVIGVDMTADMVAKARANARKSGHANVEFRLGEIEALPVADGAVDVILSNCVINLCPDKRPVYREAFRVLRPGGRIAVSDVVARGELSEAVRRDLDLRWTCVGGATPHDELLAILSEAGFVDIVIRPRGNSDEVIGSWDGPGGLAQKVFAAEVLARKPAAPTAARCCG